jgi:hypothetical protein
VCRESKTVERAVEIMGDQVDSAISVDVYVKCATNKRGLVFLYKGPRSDPSVSPGVDGKN